jgi:hypothetical protein
MLSESGGHERDESNSTEHDAGTNSVSEDFNDTQSVYSDIISATGKSSRVSINDAKRTVYKMNKLKEENLLLRESLEKANATDITTLMAKLRGCNADIVRLRQNNAELKDRIQVLEGRLFNALSNHSSKSLRSPSKEESENLMPADESHKETTLEQHQFLQPAGGVASHENRGDLMGTIKTLQSRCKHLSKLVQSYENKFKEFSHQSNGYQKGPVLEVDKSVAFDGQIKVEFSPNQSESTYPPIFREVKTEGIDSNSVLGSGTRQQRKSDKTSASTISFDETDASAERGAKFQRKEAVEIEKLRAARENDAKLIRELSAEVKRLASIVPRRDIEDGEPAANDADNDGDNYEGEESEIYMRTTMEVRKRRRDKEHSRDAPLDASSRIQRRSSRSAVSSRGGGGTSGGGTGGGASVSPTEEPEEDEEVLSSQADAGAGSSGSPGPQPAPSRAQAAQLRMHRYTPGHLFFSFFCGLVVMLVCIAITNMKVSADTEDFDEGA